MIRRNFFIGKLQNSTLQAHTEITVSEHLRRAIDEYIAKHFKKDGTSPSKGVKHG